LFRPRCSCRPNANYPQLSCVTGGKKVDKHLNIIAESISVFRLKLTQMNEISSHNKVRIKFGFRSLWTSITPLNSPEWKRNIYTEKTENIKAVVYCGSLSANCLWGQKKHSQQKRQVNRDYEPVDPFCRGFMLNVECHRKYSEWLLCPKTEMLKISKWKSIKIIGFDFCVLVQIDSNYR
jgi:hypothetical protein